MKKIDWTEDWDETPTSIGDINICRIGEYYYIIQDDNNLFCNYGYTTNSRHRKNVDDDILNINHVMVFDDKNEHYPEISGEERIGNHVQGWKSVPIELIKEDISKITIL